MLDYGEKAIPKILSEVKEGEFFRSPESDNVLILYLAAAAKLGTEDALNRARITLHSYTEKLTSAKMRQVPKLRLKQIMLFHLLCVKNGKLSEAFEVLSSFHMTHYEFLNAKACVLARLGRMEDCSLAIDGILNDTTGRPKYVFNETVGGMLSTDLVDWSRRLVSSTDLDGSLAKRKLISSSFPFRLI